MSRRVNIIRRVSFAVNIPILRLRVGYIANKRIRAQESLGDRVIISRPHVVEVTLVRHDTVLSVKEERRGGAAAAVDQFPVRRILEPVSYNTAFTGKGYSAAQVVEVVAPV